jgi:hypothetical protein
MTPESSLRWAHQGGSHHWPNSETFITLNGRRISTDAIVSCPSYEAASTPYELILENKGTSSLLFPV